MLESREERHAEGLSARVPSEGSGPVGGRPCVTEVALDLGISGACIYNVCIYNWRKQDWMVQGQLGCVMIKWSTALGAPGLPKR